MELEDISSGEPQPISTCSWLSSNPLASSFGSALSNMYCASRNYNTVTQYTIGGLESVVTYAADTAKPVYEKVVEKLDTPISTVDSMIAGKLVNLEEKYPIIGDQPADIATKSKDAVCSAFQSGQQALETTRAGRLLGYGADLTLSFTEGVVEKILPPSDSEEDEEEEEKETMESEDTQEVALTASEENKHSVFGLRKRKNIRKKETIEDEEVVVSEEVECSKAETTTSTVSRAYNLSQVVYYRTLRRLHRLQKQCHESLTRLQASIEVLKYASMISSKMGQQKETVTKALRDAESRFMQFLTNQSKEQQQPTDEFSGWLSSEKSEDDEDIKWLLDSERRKGLYQHALDYSKSASEKVYELLKSFSGISSYLPVRLREGADSALKQAKDVYTTLKENNVPSELPWFLLSQVSECVETQIMYCKKLGSFVLTTLKSRFGKTDQSSDASSHEECEVDEDNEKEEEEEEDFPDKGEIESGSETYD